MESNEKNEAAKKAVSKIRFAKNGRYIFLRLALANPHEAVGVLEDVKEDVLNIARMPRMIKQQQEAQRRAQLRGGDIKGSAQQDKSFFKKTFGK